MGGLTFNIGRLGMFADMMASGIARNNATGQAGKFGEIAQKLEGKGILEINIGSNGITGKFGMGGFDLAGSLYTFGKRMYDKKELESYLAANENKDNEDQEKKAAATAWTTYVYGDSTQENTVMRLVKDLDQLEFVSKEGKPDNWKAQTTSNGNGGRRIQMLDSGNDNINAIQLGHEAYRDGKTLTETEQKAETIAAVLGHAGMAGRMMGYAGNNITGDYALEGLLFNSGRTDILAAMADMNYDSSADYWRITADKTGKITKVQDDGDNSILTLVDEDGNIQSVTINDGTSLSKQITGLSKTRQSQKEINDIMVDSGLDFDKDGKKGWYAKSPEGQYKVGQNIPERQSVYRDVQVILSEDKKSVKDFRDITVFQEEIEDALGLKRHSACAIASIMMDTDSFLLKNYGIGARDSAQMIDILKKFATPAYETSGDNQGLVKNMTALSAFYAQGLGMDDYLIFDDDYTGTKPSKYYVEKAIFKDIKTGEIITNRTHFMTNTPFGYYDPDKTTNNRWWTKTKEHESVYRSATPKSSRINK